MSREDQGAESRVAVTIAFAVYLVLLTWVVLWKLEIPWIGEAAGLARPIKLIPFSATAVDGASAPIEVVINLVIFVPFGLFVATLAPRWAWFSVAGAALSASLLLETTQHLISTGSFDTTDLVVNTVGAAVGYGTAAAVRRRLHGRAPVVLRRICLTVTAVALLAVIAFVASPFSYGPQHDVVVERPTSR